MIAAIPVIVISAASEQMINGVRHSVLPGQAVKIIKKPLELETLLKDLHYYCGEEHKRRMLDKANAVSEPIADAPGRSAGENKDAA